MLHMEVNDKQFYEAPAIEVVEVKTESVILVPSVPPYNPEEW